MKYINSLHHKHRNHRSDGAMLFIIGIIQLTIYFIILSSPISQAQNRNGLLEQADSLSDKYKFNEAIVCAKRALVESIKQYGDRDSNTANIYFKIASYYYQNSNYDEAENNFNKSLDIRQQPFGPNNPEVASSLAGLANILEDRGQFAPAETLYDKILEIRRKSLPPDHPDIAKSLCDKASILTLKQKYPKAESLYLAALQINKKSLGEMNIETIRVKFKLGRLYRLMKGTAEAESLYQQCLKDIDQYGNKYLPDRAFILNNLGVLFINSGRPSKAIPLLANSIEIKEKILGADNPFLIPSLCNLADILVKDSNDLNKADSLYNRAVLIAEKCYGDNHPDLARILEQYSTIIMLENRALPAVEMSKRAFSIRQNNFRDMGYFLAERDLEKYNYDLYLSLCNYLSYYFDSGSKAAKFLDNTSDIVLSSKGTISDLLFDRQKSLISEKDPYSLGIADSLGQSKRRLSQLFFSGPRSGQNNEYKYRLDSLNQSIQDLETELAKKSASFRQRQTLEDISTNHIKDLLPSNTALIEYLKYDYLFNNSDSCVQRYIGVILTSAGNPSIFDLGRADQIDTLISEYRRNLLAVSSAGHMPTEADNQTYKFIARRLYDMVISPFDHILAQNDMIIIAPDGGLNLVSFAGLVDQDGRYLVENHPVHYLSAGRDLVRLAESKAKGTGLLALGDPDYDSIIKNQKIEIQTAELAPDASLYIQRYVSSGCVDLKDMLATSLPSSRNEVDEIATRWKNEGDEPASVYLGCDASEGNFKSAAPGKRIIHLATHGYFISPKCPVSQSDYGNINPLLLSGLFLAGANQHGEFAESLGIDDGILTALEVSSMDLTGTDLVVLSACETGLGEVKHGEGVYGLRRAFQMAGARTVISALWPVSDKTTSDMMSQLYIHSEKPIYERIRETQLSEIRKLRAQGLSDHPYSWAAFIAMGDWK